MTYAARVLGRNRWVTLFSSLLGGLMILGPASAADQPISNDHLVSDPNSVTVVGKDGKVEVLSGTAAPAQLDGVLSEVVENFLWKSIMGYEEKIHPTKYSELTYIEPGDDLGLMEKNGPAKSVKPEEVPEAVRKNLGEGTNPK